MQQLGCESHSITCVSCYVHVYGNKVIIIISSWLNLNFVKTLSIIYKASKLIKGMLTLYCYLVLLYLTYCCEIWGNTYATNVNRIM